MGFLFILLYYVPKVIVSAISTECKARDEDEEMLLDRCMGELRGHSYPKSYDLCQ